MTNDICQNVLEKIKKENICPVPRWKFLLKRSVFWSLFVFSLVIGSLAMAVIIFALRTNDWEFYEYIDNNFIKFLLYSLPYFWILVMGLFIVLAYYNFRCTAKGYKHNFYGIIGISLLSSVLLGYGIDKIGAGDDIEDVLIYNVAPYRNIVMQKECAWSDPRQGRLSGRVIAVRGPVSFSIVDYSEQQWDVVGTGTLLASQMQLEVEEKIKLIGKMLNEKTFEANMARPWQNHILTTCFGQ